MRCVGFAGFLLLLVLMAAGRPASAQKDLPAEIGGKSIEKWMKEIDDPDPSIRQVAIRTIVGFGPGAQKALPSLLKALSSVDANVRGDAAAALGMIRLEKKEDLTKVAASLTSLLQDVQRPVRIQAASALSVMGPTIKTKTLMSNLSFMITDTTSWEVRKTAAFAYGRLSLDVETGPDAMAMKALTAALNDGCAAVRLEAVMALSELGFSPRKEEVDAEKKALTGLLKDRDKTVGIWARVLLIFLDAQNLNATILGYLDSCLQDSEPRVRLQAVRALGALGRIAGDGKAKIPNVLKNHPGVLAAFRDQEPEVVLTALGILAPLGEAAAPAVPNVAAMLKDKELVVRCGAARALGTLGPLAKDEVPKLIEGLKDAEAQMQLSCIYALGQLGEVGKPAEPNLKELLASKEPAIKEAAGQAIKAINEKPIKKP